MPLDSFESQALCGHLELNPKWRKAVRLSGPDHSFFISCLPISSSPGPVGDSRVRAKGLSWKRELPHDKRWVVLGTQTSRRVHVEQSADGRGLDLVFRSIAPGDDGRYACEATLDGRHEKEEFELKVIEPITFDESQRVQYVEEKTSKFVLRCDVRGNPKPEVSWNVRGNIIRNAGGLQTSAAVGGRAAKYAVTQDGGLLVRNVTRADQGSYKCRVTQMEDGITDFKDMVIELRVQHAPVFPQDQRSQFYGFISGDSNLTCTCESEPPPEFIWLDKRQNELPREKYAKKGTHTSVLMLHVEHDETFGNYTCIAGNRLGNAHRVVTLSEGAKPGLPHINIIRIGPGNIVLNIEENKAEMFLEIIAFRVEVKLKMQEWEDATVIEFKKDLDRRYTIEDLEPKTHYMVRAQALNLAGASDSSNIIILQTNSLESVGELTGTEVSASSRLSPLWPTLGWALLLCK